MLSKEEIGEYINLVPAIPSVLKQCQNALVQGDLVKASLIASKDLALMNYFKEVVNKPIFGFSRELHEAKQIFGALGIVRVKQMLQSYLVMLLAPKKWTFFDFDNKRFHELQASFMIRWEAILAKNEIDDKESKALVTLIPAAIAVCESIFSAHKEDIELIKSQKDITYEVILYKLSGYDFFDIVSIIAQKWEFDKGVIELFSLMKQNGKNKIISYLLLLINYEMSRDSAIKSGINSLFELNYSFEEDEIELFYQTMSELENEANN